MNIKIETSFPEAQKAQIVSRNEQIPDHLVEFQVSNRYLKILPKFTGTYIISNESVQINNNVRFYDGNRYHSISSNVSSELANGNLIPGGSLDQLMEYFVGIIENEKKESAQKKLDEQHEEQAKRLEKQQQEQAKRLEIERYAPVRKWQEYNNSVLKARVEMINTENQKNEQARRDKIEAEKSAWIAEFGSERLKEGIRQGHECQKLYVTEKGVHVLGDGYLLDYEGDVTIIESKCPSMDALTEVNLLKENGIDSIIRWLPNGCADIDDFTDFPKEAVEVEFDGLRGYWYKLF